MLIDSTPTCPVASHIMPIRQDSKGLRSYCRGIYTITYDPEIQFRPGRQDNATLIDKLDSKPFASMLLREIYAVAPCLFASQLLCAAFKGLKPAGNIYLSFIFFGLVRLHISHHLSFVTDHFQVEKGLSARMTNLLPFILLGYGLNALLAAAVAAGQSVCLCFS